VVAEVEFSLLGPFMVRREGMPVDIAAGRQRALLAALLVNAGQVVPTDELIEVLWAASPPASARVSLHNYVKRLRKVLNDTAHRRISTYPGGYLIRVDAGELDVAQFEALLGAAQTASRRGSWDTAAAESHAALALWRGEPLADVGSEVLSLREAPRLTEMRLQAWEVRFDADLHLGCQSAVIAELQRLAGDHPLREHLHAQLMLALYRDGRQAEALAAYQNARQVLVAELGAEPGIRLRELQQQILTADPVLALPEPAWPAAAAAVRVVPRELPPGCAISPAGWMSWPL
jgi:DNA-binding SARP family transcriptional activator